MADLIIVEGFSSVWWLTQNGFPNCVSIMGSSLSEEQAKLALDLISKQGKIILMPDGDEAGRRFAEQAKMLVARKFPLRVIELPEGKQPTDFSSQELKEFIFDGEVAPQVKGRLSPAHAICQLVDQFPCMKDLGFTPENWNAEEFDRRALKFSSGEIAIAQFILRIWNPRTQWQCGTFDLIGAAAYLDTPHRNVIVDWFNRPWWP